MLIKQLSKRNYIKRKHDKDQSHWEGDYFCDCRTRNIRKWLGFKRYGTIESEIGLAGGTK